MIRLLHCRAAWSATLLCLGFLSPLPSATAGDPFAGFSNEVLVPDNPYLFANSLTLWNGYRSDRIDSGLGADDRDAYVLGLEADLHWEKLNLFGSLDLGWASDAASWDLAGGLGYDFDLTVTGIQLTPVAGYSGFHLDRNDHYDSEWAGPFLGAKLEAPLAERWLVQATYLYHWAAFEAELPALASAGAFNRADAAGHTGRIDLIYQFSERLDLRLGAQIQSFSADAGSLTRTEGAWDSWGIRAGVSLKF